jgi:hypothetical protein
MRTPEDDGDFFKGCLTGLGLSAFFWGALGAAIWWWSQ